MVTDEGLPVSNLSLVVAVVLSVAMVWVGLATPHLIAEFHSIFQGFGAELSWLSRFIVTSRILVCSILLLCLVGQVGLLVTLLKNKSRRTRALFYRAVAFNGMFFLVLIFAMYLPIFKLGSPV